MQMPSGRLSPPSAVTVDAPARLHLGFIDPNASLGRAFGSVGLTIDGHGTRITARLAEATRVEGAGSAAQTARIERYLEQLHAAYGGPPVAIDVNETPRAHTGLGSGTQLALAVGDGLRARRRTQRHHARRSRACWDAARARASAFMASTTAG